MEKQVLPEFILVQPENFDMKNGILISLLFLLVACDSRLDDNMYNASKLESYKLEAYEGYRELSMDASYNIPENRISLFTLASQTKEETKATTIYAVYIGDISRIATDTVIMYCHGNRDHMDMYWNRAKLLANVGHKNRFGVLMIDYRGYGMSEDNSSEESLDADVTAALNWLKEKGLTNERLIMYGYSLGTAPATALTASPSVLSPSKLILEAPFASSSVLVQDAAKLNMPASYFVDVKVDNAEEIKKVKQEFMWIHGINDDFLSISTHGEVVYKNYSGKYSEAHRIPQGAHNNVPQVMGLDEYLLRMEKFILHK